MILLIIIASGGVAEALLLRGEKRAYVSKP